MSWVWADYFALAGELAKQRGHPSLEEARYRTAMSRAYYAAFQTAYEHLLQELQQSVPPDANKHRSVIAYFQRSVDPVRRQIGIDLDRLRHDRNAADYDRSIARPALQCALDLSLAGEVLANLRRL